MSRSEKETLVAKFDYYATESHELTVLQGERLTLLDDSLQWWKVMNSSGEVGYVPSNYVRPVKQNLLSNLKNTLTRRKISASKVSKQCTPATHRKSRELDCPRQISVPAVLPTQSKHFEHSISNNNYNGRNTIPKTNGKTSGPPIRLNSTRPELDAGGFYSFEKKDYKDTTNGLTHIVHTYNAGCSTPVPFGSNVVPDTRVTKVPPELVEEDRLEDFQCIVLVPYEAQLADELSIRPGDRIRVYKRSADGWWFGALLDHGRATVTGWFPSNLVWREHSQSPVSTSIALVPNGTKQDADKLCTSSRLVTTPQDVHFPRETVLTLYPFARNQLEEMSFQANELLEVIDRPLDNADWWRCRNARGDVGWVPRNYVQLLSSPGGPGLKAQMEHVARSPVHQSGQSDRFEMLATCNVDSECRRLAYARRSGLAKHYISKPWFWGTLSRVECERMLRQFSVPGEFVIRDSESDPGHLTITVNTGKHNRNFKVLILSGRYHIGWRIFNTMEELIRHYQAHFIFTDNRERYSLTRPFVHPGYPDGEHERSMYSPAFRPYDAAIGPNAGSQTMHEQSTTQFSAGRAVR